LKKILIILIFFIVMTTSLITYANRPITQSTRDSGTVVSASEITLKEAINIGLKRAKEWNVKATLTTVNSVDETMGGSRGGTGKRFKWFMNFVVPGTDDYVLIGISEKKITVFRPSKQSQDPTITQQ